jgi:hypothetical protein
MFEGSLSDATRDGHVFPMIILAILSKQNILAVAVLSDAMKVSLYL